MPSNATPRFLVGASNAVVIAVALVGLAACRASGTSAAGGSSSGAPAQGKPSAQTASPKKGPSTCERKLVTADDLSDILTGPLTTKELPGDPQTCEFDTPLFTSVTLTVRSGLGDVTVKTWADGQMPVRASKISGVGDNAVWVDIVHELVATRHNVLCDIQSSGTKGTQPDLQKKFGSLCDKVWAKVK
jgi:hypothetical protein